ncbi:hypothetical protein LguiA_024416 [Lonicera macranthoides]
MIPVSCVGMQWNQEITFFACPVVQNVWRTVCNRWEQELDEVLNRFKEAACLFARLGKVVFCYYCVLCMARVQLSDFSGKLARSFRNWLRELRGFSCELRAGFCLFSVSFV